MAERSVSATVATVRLPAGASLRKLEPSDAPALAALARRLGSSDAVEPWLARLAPERGAEAVGLGVELEGGLIAYMLGRIGGGEFGLAERTAFIEHLGVEPGWQGHGLARALAEALIELLARRGAERVMTLVSGQDERVRSFFRGLGLRQSQLVCLERRL